MTEKADGARPEGVGRAPPWGRRRSAAIIVGLILLAPATAGCLDRSDEWEGGGPDVPLLRSEEPLWAAGRAWSIAPTPSVEISRNERPIEAFSDIRGALRLPDGRLVVADGASQEIRFFGPEGGGLSAVGGPGDAPGEFRGLESLFRLSDDSLVAHDASRQRVVVLDDRGTFARSVELRGAGALGHAIGLLRSKWLVVVGRPTMDMRVGQHVDSARLMRYDIASGAVDTLRSLAARERFVTTAGGTGTVMGERPFGRGWNAASFGEEIYVGTGSPFDVLVLALNGEPLRWIGRAYDARPVTRNDRKRYVDWRTSRFKGPKEFTDRARTVLSSHAAFYPVTMPAYDRLMVDQQGNLWVRAYEPPWSVQPEQWSVFQPDGLWLGVVTAPPRLEILQPGQDFVLGILRDSLDVERVALFELDKPR